MIRFVVILACALVCYCGTPRSACAQQSLLGRPALRGELPELETDRDSFTPATSTVGRRFTVLEASYSFIDNRLNPDAHSVPELLMRTGLFERFEVRYGWNYETGGPTGAVAGSDLGDEDFASEKASKVLYGFKFQQTLQSGWLPESAIIVEGYTPTSGPTHASRVVIAEVFGWTFPNKWQWNSALRYGLNDNLGDGFNQWAPSTVLKIPLHDRLNVHVEYFGVVTSGRDASISQQYISFGGHVLLTQNLELGGRFGFGLNDQTARFFNNVGIGWRF